MRWDHDCTSSQCCSYLAWFPGCCPVFHHSSVLPAMEFKAGWGLGTWLALTSIRECGSILYLGMAKEISNLPYWWLAKQWPKKLQTPQPAMQIEWYCLYSIAVHKYSCKCTLGYVGVKSPWKILFSSSSSFFLNKTLVKDSLPTKPLHEQINRMMLLCP